MRATEAHTADAKLVHAYSRALAMRRKAQTVGPFVVQISSGSASPFNNYAIPDDFAEPSPAHVADLIAAFRGHERQPRLEFIPAAAPRVEEALLNAGFSVELRPPMMVLRLGDSPQGLHPTGFELRFAEDTATLQDIVRVQRSAFSETPISGEIDVSGLERNIARGGRYLAATVVESGAVVGAGAYMPPEHGVTEVVGIAVVEGARRHGLGQAITASLGLEAFKSGCAMAFLAPAGDRQEVIYARAGFVSGTPMLYMSISEGAKRVN